MKPAHRPGRQVRDQPTRWLERHPRTLRALRRECRKTLHTHQQQVQPKGVQPAWRHHLPSHSTVPSRPPQPLCHAACIQPGPVTQSELRPAGWVQCCLQSRDGGSKLQRERGRQGAPRCGCEGCGKRSQVKGANSRGENKQTSRHGKTPETSGGPAVNEGVGLSGTKRAACRSGGAGRSTREGGGGRPLLSASPNAQARYLGWNHQTATLRRRRLPPRRAAMQLRPAGGWGACPAAQGRLAASSLAAVEALLVALLALEIKGRGAGCTSVSRG